MDAAPSRRRHAVRLLRKVTVGALAILGLISLLDGPFLRLLLEPLYDKQVVSRLYSPDRAAVAEVEVTKGGFGTVWTTRVHLRPEGEKPWTVYQTGDSAFEPPLRWSGPQTLVVGLPCDRFDHLSNPDDWERGDPNARRLKVRFEYVKACPPEASGK